MVADKNNGQHIWRFFRAGGFDQVRIDRGSDIANLKSLDQKLWAALACPTRGVEFAQTLESGARRIDDAFGKNADEIAQ